jgi:membrane fusion protein, heavy metal efflux system
MTTRTTIAPDQEEVKAHSAPDDERPTHRAGSRKWSGFLKFSIFVLVLAGTGGGIYATMGKEKVLEGLKYLKEQITGPARVPVSAGEIPPPPPKTLINGMVRVTEKERQAIGFRITRVEAQTDPIKLELNGTTDYNLNTLTKIRPRVDNALVTRVYVSAGESVKKGDPLLELRSADLAAAKNDARTKFVQWDHDHKYLIAREPLAKEGRITQIIWTDTVNDEKKSRLDYLVSRDKLATYGMSAEQIDKLLEGLRDDPKKALEAKNNTEDIAKMTVVSPTDGVVVERDVVPDNFYDMVNIMLTISPMTELWVWGNVFESDQDKVHLGQKWDILFQFSNEKFPAHVESIANGVDPETRTLRIRASIPNSEKNLKARMLVRAILQIAPLPGDTVIPRNALSVINGEYYAFVQKGESGEDADLFERRKLEIEQENSDMVVVKKGLVIGDRVVSNGSLILSQIYEDKSTVETGLPVQ